ncbi:Peroxisome biogenesis protein 19-1-like protein [Drosera capensis]
MAANHAAAADDLDDLLDSALDDFQNLNLAPPPHTDAKSRTTASASTSAGLREKEKGARLRQNTRDSVRGVEAASAGGGSESGKDAFVEEWIKQFEDFAGPQDVESIVETMMQQLLSKEILHEPMKEIGEKYPQWLEEHKTGLSEEDYKRYSHQYELIQELNGVYETDSGNFTKIVDLMQRMQECGQPPNDIVRELGPDFDLSSLGQLSPETSGPQQNCCIM